MRYILTFLFFTCCYVSLVGQNPVSKETTYVLSNGSWEKTLEKTYLYDANTNLTKEQHFQKHQEGLQISYEVWYNEYGQKQEEVFWIDSNSFHKEVFQYNEEGELWIKAEYYKPEQRTEQLERKMVGEYVNDCSILYRHYEKEEQGQMKLAYASARLYDQNCQFRKEIYVELENQDTTNLKELVPILNTTTTLQADGSLRKEINRTNCATCIDTFTIYIETLDNQGRLLHTITQDCPTCLKVNTNYDYLPSGNYWVTEHSLAVRNGGTNLMSISQKMFDSNDLPIESNYYSQILQRTITHAYNEKSALIQSRNQWQEDGSSNQLDEFYTYFDYEYCNDLPFIITTSFSNNVFKSKREFSYLQEVKPCQENSTEFVQINIYPNITSNKIVIQSDFFLTKRTSYLIVNALGQVIKKSTTHIGLETSLDTKDLPLGTFYIHFPDLGISKSFVIVR